MASAVSATFTSVNVWEEGNPPDTQAIFTPSTSSVFLTIAAKLGYTQIAATFFKSGNSSSNWFTFSVNRITLSSLSVLFSVVRSMHVNRNFLTSSVLFSGTFFSIRSATRAWISASLRCVLYFARAASYLLDSELFSSMIVQFWVIDMSFAISFRFLFHTLLKGGSDVYACLVGDA